MSIFKFGCLFLFFLCCSSSAPPSGGTASKHSNPEQVIKSCVDTLKRLGSVDPAERAIFFADGCSGIFAERGCRLSWRSVRNVPPSMRPAYLAEGCREAYCPLLEVPKPQLCAMELDGIPSSDLAQHWREFVVLVLARDLGTTRSKEFVAALSGLADQITVEIEPQLPSPQPKPGASPLVLRVESTNLGISVHVTAGNQDNLGTWQLPQQPSDADWEPVLQAADAHEAKRVVSVSVRDDVSYGVIVQLLDGLRSAGFQKVSLAAD